MHGEGIRGLQCWWRSSRRDGKVVRVRWFWHPTGGLTLRAGEELVLEGGCERHYQVLVTYQSDQVCQSFQSLQSSQAVCRSGALDPH